MWVVFYTTVNGDVSEDTYEVVDDEQLAEARFKEIGSTTPDLHCAGYAPIFNSTEHWHIPKGE